DNSAICTDSSEFGVIDGASLNDAQVNIHKEPSMINAKHCDVEVVKESTPQGSDSTKGEDHILDSPIAEELNFDHDISITMARLNNGERGLSQFSLDTLACLMELEEPFKPLPREPVSPTSKETQQKYKHNNDLYVTAVVVN